jgi:hypothetical protein
LADVDSFTAYCEGDVYAVVDEEGNFVCFAFLMEFLCNGD